MVKLDKYGQLIEEDEKLGEGYFRVHEIELIKKTPEIILIEAISIAKKYIDLKEIVGIYLTGSYARGEEDENSDIDILVITPDTDKEIIKEGSYNILIISKELLAQKLKEDLFPLGQMIREAKPLLNSEYLSSIEIKVTKMNISWYLETTEEKLKLIKKILDLTKTRQKKHLDNKIAYTLVLRIRTLEIIKRLIENQNYSKKDFLVLIKAISGGTNAYESYIAVKDNSKSNYKTSLEEIEKLYLYLREELEKIKRIKIDK